MTNVGQLQKILELEQKRGFDNQAVIGGLDCYLQRYREEDAISLQASALSYADLNREQRRQWIEDILSQSQSPAPVDDSFLDSSITQLGISITKNTQVKLAKLEVHTLRDLLYFFPRRHLDYSRVTPISELRDGEEHTIVGTVWETNVVRLGTMRCTEAVVSDETGNIRVVWFNQPYLAKVIRCNSRIALAGRVSRFKKVKQFESPEWEPLKPGESTHTGRLVPLYPLTQGLTPRGIRRLMKQVVDTWAPRVPDFIPQEIRRRCSLLDLPYAIQQAHYPDTVLLKEKSRRRLAFDELFLLQMGVLSRKREWQEGQKGIPFRIDRQMEKRILSFLPFTLTPAQRRVKGEILRDMEQPKPMCRLLQGDVGSGKTVIAVIALVMAVASVNITKDDYQTALMAPTEILAEQHFDNLVLLLSQMGHLEKREDYLCTFSGILPRPFKVALLVGRVHQRQKQDLQELLREGNIDLVIGTHALIQKGVEFQRLGLVVVDEQHRFGVMQRASLRQKGFNPHVLVMSATPIPRTLALTLYGDLDISVIDQLPKGRRNVQTKYIQPEQRNKAYVFLKQRVNEGRQAFIICPLVEESESIRARAAVTEYRRLSQEVFPDCRLALLHGRMGALEKDDVMRRFRAGEYDILVSTPVVEVGVDVPNATVMLIEGADRFGLSQLHQFRGRVGRGEHQSYCLLLAESPSTEAKERLELVERLHDGFVLANNDLELRGPGEFFGTRQSGFPDLRMAKFSDVGLLELARQEASRLFKKDPILEHPQHQLLKHEIARAWGDMGSRDTGKYKSPTICDDTNICA